MFHDHWNANRLKLCSQQFNGQHTWYAITTFYYIRDLSDIPHAGGEFEIADETLTFIAGTTELTQCINVELVLDSNFEPPSLLNEIFATNETFLGEISPLTLGQVLAVDASGKLMTDDFCGQIQMMHGVMFLVLTQLCHAGGVHVVSPCAGWGNAISSVLQYLF